jgi:hypothetical protein
MTTFRLLIAALLLTQSVSFAATSQIPPQYIGKWTGTATKKVSKPLNPPLDLSFGMIGTTNAIELTIGGTQKLILASDITAIIRLPKTYVIEVALCLKSGEIVNFMGGGDATGVLTIIALRNTNCDQAAITAAVSGRTLDPKKVTLVGMLMPVR